MVQWRFPINDDGEIKGINDSGVATFSGTPLESLAREICQNSLDAHDTSKKVNIEFSLFSIPTSDLPGSEYLIDTFDRCKEFWTIQKGSATKDFFQHATRVISNEKCSILRISDFHTTGLLGTNEQRNSDWTNLTKSSGASDKKGTAGGSYGIGKYAPFACSELSTVFYSTYNSDGEEAYQGVSRLVTFTNENNQTTQGVGYFGEEKNTPVHNEQLHLDPDFQPRTGNTYGTDIYICGYKFDTHDWENKLIVSILDGFLGAIWKDQIEVKIGNKLITKSTLSSLIDEYQDELKSTTSKYYMVLTSEETCWFEENFNGLGTIKLGLLIGEQDMPKKVSMIRQTGMKIFDKAITSQVPFAGVLFIEGDKINERLRLIENPRHDKWEPERAANPTQEASLIKALYNNIKEHLEELLTTGSEEEMDAVGIGSFIPDEDIDDADLSKDEVISDQIQDINRKVVKKKSLPANKEGDDFNTDDSDLDDVNVERGGNDLGYPHNGGHTDQHTGRKEDNVHIEGPGTEKMPTRKAVTLEKFVPVRVDKEKGIYMFKLIPSINATNGEIEVYLSAETSIYEAPIKSAQLIGGNECTVSGHIIKGVPLTKDSELRMKIELDYYEICSLEVKIYATA